MLFVDQKTLPTALLQAHTMISLNGGAKGDASKMGNEVELGLNVLSISLMLQAPCKPGAWEKTYFPMNQASPNRNNLPSLIKISVWRKKKAYKISN